MVEERSGSEDCWVVEIEVGLVSMRVVQGCLLVWHLRMGVKDVVSG